MAFQEEPSTQPIVSLSPYLGNRWWIKARVVDKSDIRTWNKQTSQGKLFGCTLVDDSAAIRATFFNEAVDQFFQVLQAGQVYYVSGGSIKTANKKFSSVNNDYECSFDKDAQIRPCRDAGSAPMQRYNFVPIMALTGREVGTLADVLGIVSNVGGVAPIMTKSGQEMRKRTMTLVDKTASVECTLWNAQAESFDKPVGTTLALKGAKIGSFNGVQLGCTMNTIMDDQLQLAEVGSLREWYANTGGSGVPSISTGGGDRMAGDFQETKRKYFDDIAREHLGRGEKGEYVDIRCMPTFIKTDNLWYDACATCNKKVQGALNNEGKARCEKCDTFVKPEARYMCSIQASDNMTIMWITMFNDVAKVFFGVTAAELKQEAEANSEHLAKVAQKKLYTPVVVRCRVKEEIRDDGPRTNITAVRITELDNAAAFSKEGHKLCDAIALY